VEFALADARPIGRLDRLIADGTWVDARPDCQITAEAGRLCLTYGQTIHYDLPLVLRIGWQ